MKKWAALCGMCGRTNRWTSPGGDASWETCSCGSLVLGVQDGKPIPGGSLDATTMAATGQLPNEPFVPTHWMPLRTTVHGYYERKDGSVYAEHGMLDGCGVVPAEEFGSSEKMCDVERLESDVAFNEHLVNKLQDESGRWYSDAKRLQARCDRLELELRRAGRKVPE